MSLTDDEFVGKLRQLQDAKQVEEMRAVLKDCGGMGRLITLAERGLGPLPKKAAPAVGRVEQKIKTRIADDFPDQAMKDRAVAYWGRKRRPDLVANVDHEVEKFVNRYVGNGEKAESWPAKWQTWCANALEFNRPPRSDGGLFQAARLAFEQTNETGWLARLRGFYETGFWGDTWGVKPPASPADALPTGCMCPAGVLKKYAEQRRSA